MNASTATETRGRAPAGHTTDWREDFRARWAAEARAVAEERPGVPGPFWALAATDWGQAAALAAALGARHVGVWGDLPASSAGNTQEISALAVYAGFERAGQYLFVHTIVPLTQPELPSQARIYPGIARLERHAQDLLGLRFVDHPDGRRWTRHNAWPAERFPLRPEFPRGGEPSGRARADADYPFAPILGAGVYEIPVGPIHAGIIEPGHFRFQAAGEEVLRLEERLGYVHRGVENWPSGARRTDWRGWRRESVATPPSPTLGPLVRRSSVP